MKKRIAKEKVESPAKVYLNKIKECDDKINAKLAEIDHLYELATRITPYIKENAGASPGGNQDKLGEAVSKIADLRSEVNRDIDSLVDMKRKIIGMMEKLKNPDHYRVLHFRYILYYTFERTATEMNYSYRGICYLHGRALEEFAKLMEAEGVGENEA